MITVYIRCGKGQKRIVRISDAITSVPAESQPAVNFMRPQPDMSVRKRRVKPNTAVEDNPVLHFLYPSSKFGYETFRAVKVIASNQSHLIGLETSNFRTPSGEIVQRHQFKKFCWAKMRDTRMNFQPEKLLTKSR